MIEDFHKQLEAYAFPESIEGTKEYLSKYWLSKQEYLSVWQPVQKQLFSENEFPGMVFQNGIELLVNEGGILFEQEEFALLKECVKHTNDNYIFIVEDYNEQNPPHETGPILRFKFPANITWEKINIGDGVSYELFQRPVRNFYVFGDTANWGKYAANDYEFPLDILGFKKEFATIFSNRFKLPEKEREELNKSLPKEYQDI